MKLVTLAACRNRRKSTLEALTDLYDQLLPAGTEIQHVIVDDGSVDGTFEAVSAQFPDVEVIAGSGSLFWAGGMRFGWEHAVSQKDFDYLFVYNDDARFERFAIASLLEAALEVARPLVVVGSFLDTGGNETTYGGRRRSSRWHPLKFAEIVEPDGTVQEADTLNMNGALISRSALSKVGFLSDFFVHSGADFEYGLKVRQAGGKVLVAPRYIGRCELNPESANLPQHAEKLGDSLRLLLDQKREPFMQRLNYYRRHGGSIWPLWFVAPYVTIWFRNLGKHLGKIQRGGHTS